MLKIKKNTIVYIFSPVNKQTGGVEALHQLCDAFNNNGVKSEMIYASRKKGVLGGRIGEKLELVDKDVPTVYRRYNVIVGKEIKFNQDNILIFPEVWTRYIKQYSDITKVIWWLSVDNNVDEFKDYNDNSLHHFYQSVYALHHLVRNGVENYYPVYDYITVPILDGTKTDSVCYNPKKGMEHTKKIIEKLAEQYQFVALENMKPEEVGEALSKSKIYIDFGGHPGKDRMPREAVLNNNIIITSLEGSAFYSDDVKMPMDYKFQPTSVDRICNRIKECMAQYDSLIDDFVMYKKRIEDEKNEFMQQVKDLI